MSNTRSHAALVHDLLQQYLQARLNQQSPDGPRPRSDRSQPAPLSSGQEQIWLHTRLAPDTLAYNETVTIHRRGPLNIEILQRCLDEILRRHEAWRTSFPIIDGQPVQLVHAPQPLPLSFVELTHLPREQREAKALAIATEQARQVFDLETGPLLRATLVRMELDEYRLFLGLHHIIFDGVSLYRVFLPELVALYEAFSLNQPSPLPELSLQYGD